MVILAMTTLDLRRIPLTALVGLHAYAGRSLSIETCIHS